MRNIILLIAVGIIIWIVGRMFKNKALKSRPRNPQENNQKNEIKTIVQCATCQAFIPEDKAIKQDQQTFCSNEHLTQWNDQH